MKILKLIKGLKKYIFIMVIFYIIQVFCELYLPNIMSDIVDIGIIESNKSYIIKEILLMIGISIIGLISNVIVVYSTSKFSNNYGYNIRAALYKKINSFSKREILSSPKALSNKENVIVLCCPSTIS